MSEPVSMAEMVTLNIDGMEVSVPKGTLVIRAAEAAGIAIPRFCDHPLLDPAGSCRQCLVDISDAGNGRGFPMLQPACTTEAANGMVLSTGATSEKAAQGQADILEFLLLNHPLDCPICDKAGECPLQNQDLANGRSETRYDGVKRTYPKPVKLSEMILLDRERCVLCARCTRFSDQIAGDPMIQLVERGAKQQVGIYADQPYDSYFAGNVVQICPVGALTSADYRFSARPFDLVSTVTTCENCAGGCELRVDSRHFEVRRRYAGDKPEVNEEWSCDKGRFGFRSGRGDDHVIHPMMRVNGELTKVSWPQALAAAAAGLKAAGSSVGVLTGGRLTMETSYAYSKFARLVLGTNSVDFRARAASAEEADFLAAHIAGRRFGEAGGVTYSDLETAAKVVLVELEPEDEAPMIFLRLRKANRKRRLVVETIAPYLTRGSAKVGARLIASKPTGVPAAIRALELDADTIVLVGERLARIAGGFTALDEVVEASGARLAWVPRRAGEVGAIEAGLLPGLLPGGRPEDDPEAAAQMSEIWGAPIPATPGQGAASMIAKAADGELKALLTAGIEAGDFPDPSAVIAAVGKAFTVCLTTRTSDITGEADVVLPVDLLEQTTGTFLNWEHRLGPVNQVVTNPRSPMTEIRVLAALAAAMGADLGFRGAVGAGEELAGLPVWDGSRVAMTPVTAPDAAPSGVVVASWRELVDDSRQLDGATALAATARRVVARMSPQTVRTEGLVTSSYVRLTGPRGSVTFPLTSDPTMTDGVVWVPERAPGNSLAAIGVHPFESVTLAAAPDPKKEGEE